LVGGRREAQVKIAVLVKQVPSSEARIKIGGDGRSVDPAEVQYVINPYDEYAMEAALQLKEKFGGEVLAISVGGAKAEEALRSCLALGADRALLLKERGPSSADALIASGLLAAALRAEGADLILAGKVSIDAENAAVGVQVAELLGLPHVSVVTKLEAKDEKHLVVHREIEGGAERIEVELPAVLTANKGLNEPRYASLKGIMAAKKKPFEIRDGVPDPAGVEQVTLLKLEYPAPRGEGKIFKDEPGEAVRHVVNLLRGEAKVL
jgi:electron transfer flavoprotein beta subunit